MHSYMAPLHHCTPCISSRAAAREGAGCHSDGATKNISSNKTNSCYVTRGPAKAAWDDFAALMVVEAKRLETEAKRSGRLREHWVSQTTTYHIQTMNKEAPGGTQGAAKVGGGALQGSSDIWPRIGRDGKSLPFEFSLTGTPEDPSRTHYIRTLNLLSKAQIPPL